MLPGRAPRESSQGADSTICEERRGSDFPAKSPPEIMVFGAYLPAVGTLANAEMKSLTLELSLLVAAPVRKSTEWWRSRDPLENSKDSNETQIWQLTAGTGA